MPIALPDMTEPVVTRFAPSPTGFLHIGGARTALFNWLYARGRGGKMLLRIEDTDRERSTKAAIDAILDGLTWLGLDWDGDAVYQFSRAARHREVAEQLLAAGKAYRCYATPEELDADAREGRAPRARPGSMTAAGATAIRPTRRPASKPAIRLKAPLTGETVVEDQVQGRVAWQNENLDDFVLLRSDGTPTYMLAVVVDDHDMGVTHIIRGDDHLTNAARQTQIYEALGWNVPVMAHIPLIHGPDGSKLSKRHGALGVDAYRAHGLSAGGDAQLPRAARLEPRRPGDLLDRGDDRGVRPAADRPLAGALRLRQAGEPERPLHARDARTPTCSPRSSGCCRYLPDGAELAREARRRRCASKLMAAMPGLKERAKTLVELLDAARFLWADRPLPLDDKAAALLTPDARGAARRAGPGARSRSRPGRAEATEAAVRAFAERKGAKLGAVAQPLRAALTGRTTSPGIFDVLAVLGTDESLARLQRSGRASLNRHRSVASAAPCSAQLDGLPKLLGVCADSARAQHATC